jgi:hypothetical protein
MKKRGQVTIFIVAGLAIALVVGLAVYYSTSISDSARAAKASEVATLPADLQQAGKDIESCIAEVGEFALSELGLRGGYLGSKAGVNTVSYIGEDVAYLYDNGKNNVPLLADMESELGSFVKENIVNCTSFVTGVEASSSKVKAVTVKIEDKVNFFVEWPVSFKKASVKSKISKFSVDVDAPLKLMVGIADNLVKAQMAANGSVCISCVVDEADKGDIMIGLFFHEKATIYKMHDPEKDVSDVPYAFNFAGG